MLSVKMTTRPPVPVTPLHYAYPCTYQLPLSVKKSRLLRAPLYHLVVNHCLLACCLCLGVEVRGKDHGGPIEVSSHG